MESVIEDLERCVSSEDLSYFENARFLENPVYHSLSGRLDLHIETEKVLP